MRSLRRALLKNNKLLFVAAISGVLIGKSVLADDSTPLKDALGWSGSLRGDYWSQDRSFSGNSGFGVGSAWLDLKPQDVSGFKFFGDGYVLGQNLSRTANSVGELREGYVEKSVGDLDLRVGRQIIVWGRADKINPTDNFSTRNYTLLMTDDEDERLGIFSTKVTYNLGDFRIIGVWQPEWRDPVFPLPPLAGIAFSADRPVFPQNQLGFKIDHTGIVDWSLSFYDGYDKNPDLRLVGALPQGGYQVALTYKHIQTWGADFATNLGSYGWRGEVAYTQTEDGNGSDLFTKNPFLFAVLGVDHSIVENFNINIQGLYRHVFQFQSPYGANPVLLPLALQESIFTNQQFVDQGGFSLRPNYKLFNETLELEVALVQWFGKGDNLISPKVTYALSDKWKVIAGAVLFNGPSDSFYGEQTTTSAVFAEFRYLF